MKADQVVTVLLSDGRLSIPKAIQDALGIKPGGQLKVKVVDEQIVLQPILKGSLVDVLYEMFAGEDFLTDLENERRQEIEEQNKPTQQITPESTIEQLLGALEQLSPQELMAFEEKFFEMKQQRIASIADEKVLQQQIAYRFPKRKKQRMRALLSKSNAGVITQAEKLELDGLIEEFEQKSLEKAEAMYLLTQRKQKIKNISDHGEETHL